MPDLNRLTDYLRFDVSTMSIILDSKHAKMAMTLNEFIDSSIAQGVSPDILEEELLNDLLNDGRLFSDFRRQIKATTNGIIKKASDSGQFAEDDEVEVMYRWVAVSDKNVCPDCIERHGEVHTLDEWTSLGMPATGFTVCKDNCRCKLIIDTVVKIDPIKIGEE